MISGEHVVDFDNLILTSKEVYDEWEYLISEHDGYYSQKNQNIYFDFKGIEICVGFELTIRGWSWYRPSSYMEPEDGEVKITSVEIDVEYLLVADEEVALDKELKKTLEIVVNKYVNYE